MITFYYIAVACATKINGLMALDICSPQLLVDRLQSYGFNSL